MAEHRSGRIVVTVRGEHDLSTAGALHATVAGAIALGDAPVVLDLSLVGFLDASTIRVVEQAHDELRRSGRSLSVRDPSACARRLLDLCGFADLVEADADPDLDLPAVLGGPPPWELHPSRPGSRGAPLHPARGRLSLCPAPAPD